MGLTIEIGLLADLRENDQEGYEERLQQFVVVNQALGSAGLPDHHEPVDLRGKQPWWCNIGGYGTIRYLRRLAAHLWARGGVHEPDLPENAFDPVVSACFNGEADRSSPLAAPHLLFHSDDAGFYLPAPFEQVIRPDDRLFETTGGWIGSSRALLKECCAIAEGLDLSLNDNLISAGEA